MKRRFVADIDEPPTDATVLEPEGSLALANPMTPVAASMAVTPTSLTPIVLQQTKQAKKF